MFTKTRDGAEASNSQAASNKRPSRSAPSIISGDMQVNGQLTAAGDIQVDGKVDGDITSGSLTIGEKAQVSGDIMAEEVIVRGKVVGSIRARKVQLCSTAHVEGDIFHQALAVETGAYFEGNCRHSDDPLKEKPGASRPASPGRRVGTGPAPRPDGGTPEGTAPPAAAAAAKQAQAEPGAPAPVAKAPIPGPGPGGPSPRVPGGLIGRAGPVHMGRRPEPVANKGRK